MLMIGGALIIWEISIYRKTIIDVRIPILIIIITGVIANFIDRPYFSTYETKWGNGFALLQNFVSWGFIVCTLFMACNKFFAKPESTIKEYRIEKISDMPGPKGMRSHKSPLVRIDYKGKPKELVFSHKYLGRIEDYQTVTLETKKGFFGFDIIEKQELNK
ncbi:MAG: hypothetical protein DWQ02_27235 [Bacteroidetes bacterium]|nr:MAG: hypothetical protein DWQ02_27235 [Bacteroidota bacterium]